MEVALLKSYWVYILASRPRGILYTGMSSELMNRTWEHRSRVLPGFTSKYWVQRLVYYEEHDDPEIAARRERAIKRWRRDWKIELIERDNPTWRDLYPDVIAAAGFEP